MLVNMKCGRMVSLYRDESFQFIFVYDDLFVYNEAKLSFLRAVLRQAVHSRSVAVAAAIEGSFI